MLPGENEVGIRLVNDQTNNTYEGRLEVKYNDQWGSVCINRFDFRDARVACRQLFGDSSPANLNSNGQEWGDYVGIVPPVWLDEVGCSGSETNIGLCMHPGFGTTECNHQSDVYLQCSEGELCALK